MIAFFVKKLGIISVFTLLFAILAASEPQELPGFRKGEVVHFSPLTTSLVCTWDGYPPQCHGERHTNFDVVFFDVEKMTPLKVGEVLIQVKGPGSYDYDSLDIGTHVRIRHIGIDEGFQRKGIGTATMRTLLTFYKVQGGFESFKLEASDMVPYLSKWYQKFGFARIRHIAGASDVCIYTKKK